MVADEGLSDTERRAALRHVAKLRGEPDPANVVPVQNLKAVAKALQPIPGWVRLRIADVAEAVAEGVMRREQRAKLFGVSGNNRS
jgi:hypothetical protein